METMKKLSWLDRPRTTKIPSGHAMQTSSKPGMPTPSMYLRGAGNAEMSDAWISAGRRRIRNDTSKRVPMDAVLRLQQFQKARNASPRAPELRSVDVETPAGRGNQSGAVVER